MDEPCCNFDFTFLTILLRNKDVGGFMEVSSNIVEPVSGTISTSPVLPIHKAVCIIFLVKQKQYTSRIFSSTTTQFAVIVTFEAAAGNFTHQQFFFETIYVTSHKPLFRKLQGCFQSIIKTTTKLQVSVLFYQSILVKRSVFISTNVAVRVLSKQTNQHFRLVASQIAEDRTTHQWCAKRYQPFPVKTSLTWMTNYVAFYMPIAFAKHKLTTVEDSMPFIVLQPTLNRPLEILPVRFLALTNFLPRKTRAERMINFSNAGGNLSKMNAPGITSLMTRHPFESNTYLTIGKEAALAVEHSEKIQMNVVVADAGNAELLSGKPDNFQPIAKICWSFMNSKLEQSSLNWYTTGNILQPKALNQEHLNDSSQHIDDCEKDLSVDWAELSSGKTVDGTFEVGTGKSNCVDAKRDECYQLLMVKTYKYLQLKK